MKSRQKRSIATYRLDDRTQAQLAWLCAQRTRGPLFTSRTEVIAQAIDRLYRDETAAQEGAA